MKKTSLVLLLSAFIFTVSCKKDTKEKVKEETNKVAVNSEVDENVTATEVKEVITTETEEVVEEVKVITKPKEKVEISHNTNTVNNGSVNTTNQVEEVVQATTNTVVTNTNTVIEEAVEKPIETVTETVQEVTETVVETPTETITPPKPDPKPVVQELTLKQKIVKGKTLFNTGICKTCHDPKKKKIGPTLTEISKKYHKKKASIAKFLAGNGKSIVWPDKYFMMKPNVDDVTSKMPKGDLEALEAYIMSL